MTHRVRSAFGRFFALCAVLAVATSFVAPLAAQQTTGKIEGTVTDQAGVPLANAQVFVVGTSFGAVTSDKGYYFINNVPVGSYTLRAQFIGYAPTEVRDARVFGGQTMTVNVKLTPSAIQVGGVSVEAANPIVPRDQVTSKATVSGATINSLPVDDVARVISLQPGVVEGVNGGIILRGGRQGEANVYIDGAPVRSQNSGNQAITVGTNAVEEASVTTGSLGVQFGDAQSGVISYTTKAGGTQLSGNLSYGTDEPFGNAISVGLNRFEGSIGGPIPMVQNLKFFLSGTLTGQLSPLRGMGWDKVPTYTIGGADTVVTTGSGGTTNSFTLPLFVQYTGQCDAANNSGFECQGRRFPMNWSNGTQLQGKLSYSYGSGSSLSLTGIAAGQQGRNWPGSNIADAALYSGFHNWQRSAIVNLNHSFFKSAERELALNINASFGQDRGLAGPLDPSIEGDTRNPTMGITFKTLRFSGFGDMPFPITDAIVRNVRSNEGLRVPLLDRDDLRNRQPFRMNPFGMQGGSWITDGFDIGGTLSAEDRYRIAAQVDWQANRFHRFNFGGEYKKNTIAYWNSGFLRQSFMDVYRVKPVVYAAWGADRLDLGDVVLELGLRYDYMDSKALFANTPGRIFTNPAWQNGSATNDAAYDASLAAVFTPAEAHHTLSPRLLVSFPITEKTDFRLSYSHAVQTPDFLTLLSGVNNDLSFTNTNDAFGRDVTFGKSIQFEFGVRHAFSPDLVLDVSAYNKDKVSDLTYRIKAYADPTNCQGGVCDITNVNVLTNADFGYARGIDFKLDKRVGSWMNFAGSYTFQVARSTGSDPFSYLNTSARQISQVTGDRLPPPEQPLPTNDNRMHNFVGSLALTVPSDWQKGTTIGAVLRNVGAFATFRAVSGLPYTRLRNSGGGNTAPALGFGLISTQVEPINSSTMPWTKNIDLRLNKALRIGRADVTAFADLRNAFNWKNVVRLFAETDDVVNALHRETLLSPEFANLRIEADANGRLLTNGSIDLRPTCAGWTSGAAGADGPVNCVELRRVEARFGDGDGVYTLAEQGTALNAYYDLFNGVQNFYGAPRNIRVGFELNF
jgi:Carboxypeptidase regulatory-like domain/TonB-dependent Receptor Plug Domain